MSGKGIKVTIPTFDWSAKNKYVEWEDFKLGIESVFLTPSYKEIEDKEDRVNLILNWMGNEALKKFKSWTAANQTSARTGTAEF